MLFPGEDYKVSTWSGTPPSVRVLPAAQRAASEPVWEGEGSVAEDEDGPV